MYEPTYHNTKIVWPNYQSKNSPPERKMQKSNCKKPSYKPNYSHRIVFFNFYHFHICASTEKISARPFYNLSIVLINNKNTTLKTSLSRSVITQSSNQYGSPVFPQEADFDSYYGHSETLDKNEK